MPSTLSFMNSCLQTFKYKAEILKCNDSARDLSYSVTELVCLTIIYQNIMVRLSKDNNRNQIYPLVLQLPLLFLRMDWYRITVQYHTSLWMLQLVAIIFSPFRSLVTLYSPPASWNTLVKIVKKTSWKVHSGRLKTFWTTFFAFYYI